MAGLVGCTVGPNYKRPAVDVPGAYRGVAPDASDKSYTQPESGNPQQPETQTAAQSLGDEKWWEVFQDQDLQDLIRTALKNNYDVRIAATRVLQAQAQLGITRADQFPTLSVGGNITSQQSPKIGPIPAYEVTQGLSRLRQRHGIRIFGESIVGRPNLPEPIYSPMSGRRRKSSRLWSRMWQPVTFPFGSWTWNWKFPSAPTVPAMSRCS